MDNNQVKDWLNNASQDDVIAHAKTVLSKIGSYDQTSQERFARELRQDPTTAKLFENLVQPTG